MCISQGMSRAGASETQEIHVRAVCFSSDDTHLATTTPQNSNISLWDVSYKTWTLAKTLKGHKRSVYSLAYVGSLVASGSDDRTVRLRDGRSAACKAIFYESTNDVTSVAFSPDGRFVAASSLNCIVRVWDVEASQLVASLEGHLDSTYSVAFAPDGTTLVSGALDNSVMLWSMNMQSRTQSRPQQVFHGHQDFVLSVGYSPDGRWLLSGSKDKSVKCWDPRATRAILTLTGYRNSIISIASSSSSSRVATGSGDTQAVIYNYQGGTR